ncbi:ABC transporter substrate-binding protein [Oceanibacterium hippocampi]|uniref:Leucine-, isoleucine-, valine-, threonine-, and alanine-binding protein n=1 Tax=Oceanibacterium hippocampi TaxID=745714 RepID=A0A1Y5TNF1_9PROT|nr:ABC transporter substrate-binding protein [Oceanibacterium hippocampi]SLN64352.1 Leucine-, isoleucine-, valine-, threonine-, and alanine-binding protein precursor [Oceanibacterium hippocampi]
MRFNRREIMLTGAASLAAAMAPVGFARAAEPYRIGALNPITGAGSPYGSGTQKTILFAAQEVNDAGGAAGRMFEVFAEDTQTAPEAGVLAAKKLIEVNKVDAIFGTWSSGVTLAIMPLTDAANVILMTNSGAASISTLDTKDLVYRYSTTGIRSGRAISGVIEKEGLTRVATMAFNNASGRDLVAGVKSGWEEKGHSLVAEVVYEPNRPGYRSELQQILAAKPEIIMLGSYLPDTTIIVREARQMGSDVRFIGPGYAIAPKLSESLGAEAVEGLMAVDYVSSLDSSAYAHFSKRYQDEMGSDVGENFYASCAYDMVQCTALAIEAAGPGADNTKIAANLRKVSNPGGKVVSGFAEGKKLLAAGEEINYEGASGPLDFDEHGDVKPLFKLSKLRSGALEYQYMLSL